MAIQKTFPIPKTDDDILTGAEITAIDANVQNAVDKRQGYTDAVKSQLTFQDGYLAIKEPVTLDGYNLTITNGTLSLSTNAVLGLANTTITIPATQKTIYVPVGQHVYNISNNWTQNTIALTQTSISSSGFHSMMIELDKYNGATLDQWGFTAWQANHPDLPTNPPATRCKMQLMRVAKPYFGSSGFPINFSNVGSEINMSLSVSAANVSSNNSPGQNHTIDTDNYIYFAYFTGEAGSYSVTGNSINMCRFVIKNITSLDLTR